MGPKSESSKKINVGLIISGLALLISLGSFLITMYGKPGTVTLFEPSCFGIVRKNTNYLMYGGPSDRFVFPLEWENSSGITKVIKEIQLTLREIRFKKEQYKFKLAGEIRDLTNESLSGPYNIIYSFILPSNSITNKILIFHNEEWWNKKSERYYNLKFKPGEIYEVWIEYKLNNKRQQEKHLTTIWIDESLCNIDNGENCRGWELWYIDEGEVSKHLGRFVKEK